jgi:uncharacterized membrane protein
MAAVVVQAIRFPLTIACLLFVHVAILRGAYAAAVGVGLIYACTSYAIAWSTGDRRPLRSPWLVPVVLMMGAQLGIWFGYTSAVAIVLAPSVIMNVLLFVLFGNTLLPGREPLITRFRRLEEGFVSPMFVSYTRCLTVLWTVLFAIATMASLVAAVWGDMALWSWVSLIAVPAASLTFFLGEHVYRALRYGREGRSSPFRTLRTTLRPDAWRDGPISQPGVPSRIHE